LKYGGGSAFQAPYSGGYHYNDSIFFFQGSSGHYWSSTQYGSDAAYILGFASNGNLTTSNAWNRYYYFAVRCYLQ
jgi:uncharacterized protein (TIGR02145 family)